MQDYNLVLDALWEYAAVREALIEDTSQSDSATHLRLLRKRKDAITIHEELGEYRRSLRRAGKEAKEHEED